MPKRGRFITLEGGEGAGKSTQAHLLAQRLVEADFEVVVTREPGGSPMAEALRTLILSGAAARYGAAGEAILFGAARIDHLDRKIRPALKAGHWVVCDRFLDSTRAYQGAAGRLDPEIIAGLERVTIGQTMPDLTLILDLAPELGMQRAEERRVRGESPDRFEGQDLAFHQTLRRAFLAIASAEPARCVAIDAGAAIEAVAEEIWTAVKRRFRADLKLKIRQ